MIFVPAPAVPNIVYVNELVSTLLNVAKVGLNALNLFGVTVVVVPPSAVVVFDVAEVHGSNFALLNVPLIVVFSENAPVCAPVVLPATFLM